LKVLYFWGPVIAVMAAIFYTSSLSDPGAPPGQLSDKGAHLIAYAALGGSLIRALAEGRAAAMTTMRVLAAFVIATIYGVTDEVHQSFVPNRTPEVLDLVADATGALMGALGVAIATRLLHRMMSSG
jgi:VanZ family protein